MPEVPPGGSAVREAFLVQANACDSLGSPFMARLCRLFAERIDETSEVGRTVLSWQGDPSSKGDALALRLTGALHALVLSGTDRELVACYPPAAAEDDALWCACAKALTRHADFVVDRLKSAPQTNEVRRSGALLPGFLTVAAMFGKPLVLSEIGASAGLNLQWDRYRYQLGQTAWAAASSPVSITPDWAGPPPPMADLQVAARAGCDLNPLDPGSLDDRLRLLSYVWADQADRLERSRHALAIAAAHGQNVDRADAVDWLRLRLSQRFTGAVHVVYHSIAWQYLPAARQQEGHWLFSQAGAGATGEAPLAHLQVEADDVRDGAAISLQVWPSGERHLVGRADFHGRWVRWTGWPGLR